MKKTKKEIEASLKKKYLKRITQSVRNKYRRLANNELKNKGFYLNKGDSTSKINELKQSILKSYEPLIQSEIDTTYNSTISSSHYEEAIRYEEKIQSNKLHFKNIKEYQRLPIHIPEDFINSLKIELNKDLKPSESSFEKEEIQYLTLITLYGIIDYIRRGFIVKVGTCMNFFTKKRDIRVNLPDEKIRCERILEDRIIPKIQLCKTFGRDYFMKINEGNQAIINYYKEKTERYLMLIKVRAFKDAEK